MTVSIKFVNTKVDVCGDGASVVCMSPANEIPTDEACGDGAPAVCISPANAVPESAHDSVIAKTKRFISDSPLRF